MALDKEREELIVKIANELTFEEAVEIFRLVMEDNEDNLEKYSCMRMGCDDKLFSLVVAFCDKDKEIHDKLGGLIQEEFSDCIFDEDSFQELLESGHNCSKCAYFNKENSRCRYDVGEFIKDPEHEICSNFIEGDL